MAQIQAAFDRPQAEIAHLSQRTRESMVTAKMKGCRIGRRKGEAVETKKAKESNPLIRDLARRYGGQTPLPHTRSSVEASSLVSSTKA